MEIVQCDDKHGYGCTRSVEVHEEADMLKLFYLKDTHSGAYFQRTCKECTKRKHHENYMKGKYGKRNGKYTSITESQGDEAAERCSDTST